MANRTPPSQWGNLFNFAGGGLVHNEIFALLLVSALNPTLFEAIGKLLLPFGPIADRPTATDVPEWSLYLPTDEAKIYQNQEGTWEEVGGSGGGGGGGDGCRVYNNANISIPSGVNTALTFNTERFDNGGMHSTVTNTGRITIQTSGVYIATASVALAGVTGQSLAPNISITLNGSTALTAISFAPASTGVGVIMSISTCYEFAAADYIEVFVYQATGSATNATASGNYSPEFTAQQIA